jgi:NAD(P) transhydrogenase subunit alpha
LAITVGVPCENFPGERRVALSPRSCEALLRAKMEVVVESSAGVSAGFPDEQYVARGARIGTREEVFAAADVLLQARTLGANPGGGRTDIPLLKPGQVVIGFAEPLTAIQECAEMARAGVSLFAMELIPRITRAQSMDALSSMASIAGYEAVLLAATTLPKLMPMMMTAAGTITPAKVLVIGAGVAGLQAIATARRLGAVVSAYDLRAVVKEQVESLGAKFVVLKMGESGEGQGGYAKAMDEAFYAKQRQLLAEVLREQDVVITTAAVPGRKAPVLITRTMAEAMLPGSVIVDIAAERGGNCELTRAGETVVHNGVTILGPLNLPSLAPFHSSQMLGSNFTSLLKILVKDGSIAIDREDEIVRESLVAHQGHVVNAKVRELLEKEVDVLQEVKQ